MNGTLAGEVSRQIHQANAASQFGGGMNHKGANFSHKYRVYRLNDGLNDFSAERLDRMTMLVVGGDFSHSRPLTPSGQRADRVPPGS